MIPVDDIVKGLKSLTVHGVTLRQIETVVGMPQNSLSRNLKNGTIPNKFKESLFEYLKEKEIEIIMRKTKKLATVNIPADFVGVDKLAVISASGQVEELSGKLPEWAYKYCCILAEKEQLDPNSSYKFKDGKLIEIAEKEADKSNKDSWIPPHPKKEDFENSWEYGFAKSEWKKKYNLT